MNMLVGFNVDQACTLLGFSRQAYYKSQVDKSEMASTALQAMLPGLIKARRGNPTKGCRAMYNEYGHSWPMGRDWSENLLLEAGYRVKYPKHYRKATQSGNREFPNLLVNLEVTGINQVWQADMAHYLYGDKPFYTIYITDVYSQEVVGYGAYSTNMAINYVDVLNRAVYTQRRFTNGLSQLIHHSDGGKQYESTVYKQLCQKHEISQSMCMYSYENPYAEKTNDLINNGYLNVWKPRTLKEIKIKQRLAVIDHNTNSRKKALGNRTPLEFKTMLLSKEEDMQLYTLKLKPTNPEQPRNKELYLDKI